MNAGTPDGRRVDVFLAGDALVVEPWSQVVDPAFVALVERMRAADATIVNLETVVHEFRHPAQADSGGTYMATPPSIAAELRWAGVDMVSSANNHAFDYGSGGILETLAHVGRAGIAVAGIGPDLQHARAPVYHDAAGTRLALVLMAATFHPCHRASASRADVAGRPGVNPLAITHGRMLTLPARALDWVGRLHHLREGRPIPGEKRLRLLRGAIEIRGGPAHEIGVGARVVAADRRANLDAVRDAAKRADIVIAAIHSHDHRRWLRRFAHEAIDAGAAVVHVHGLHAVRGVEIHRGAVVLYGLGDFVYQPHRVARFPSDQYEQFGLSPDARPEDAVDYHDRRYGLHRRETFEGAAALVSFRDRRPAAVRLLPIDLGFGAPPEERGRPGLARGALGRRIVATIARRSKRYGTRVSYDEARDEGVVPLA